MMVLNYIDFLFVAQKITLMLRLLVFVNLYGSVQHASLFFGRLIHENNWFLAFMVTTFRMLLKSGYLVIGSSSGAIIF